MSAPKLEWPLGIEVPGEPMGGAAGDFDRDGAVDVATVNVDGTVSVFLGEGDGTFGSSASYATGLEPGAEYEWPYVWAHMLAADLDGNGAPDLVTTNGYQTRVSVLLSAGGAAFAVGVTYDVGFEIGAVVSGGDKILDLVVIETDASSVYLGAGDGSFKLLARHYRTISDAVGRLRPRRQRRSRLSRRCTRNPVW